MPDPLPSDICVTPLPAFTDNYIWCFANQRDCMVVDPGDGQVVLDYCQQHQLNLVAVLITHHHADHTGGLPLLVKQFPDCAIIGPQNPKIKQLNQHVSEGGTVTIDPLSLRFNVLEVPGHTLDHIAFVGHGGVLCGDTLFSVGCGRLFEGSPAQMMQSLGKLTDLPDDTLVWCTHEYTLANIDFALQLEPSNQALQKYQHWAKQQRNNELPTLPSTIAEQLAINPFLRSSSPEIKAHAQTFANQSLATELEVFSAVRAWKDRF